MKLTEIERRVRQVTWPAPPQTLRARVLLAAAIQVPQVTWSDRVWFSRAWRLSAVVAVLVLVALEQYSASPRSAALAPSPQVLAEARVVEEAGRQVGLSPEVAKSLAERGLAEAIRPGDHFGQAWTSIEAFDSEGERR